MKVICQFKSIKPKVKWAQDSPYLATKHVPKVHMSWAKIERPKRQFSPLACVFLLLKPNATPLSLPPAEIKENKKRNGRPLFFV